MLKPNQKNFLIIFSVLLLTSFLFFLPQRACAGTPVWTVGWYEDKGTGETDPSCPAGKWRASIELRDDLGEPLLADKITIRAIWYEEGTDIGVEIYRTEAANLTSHIFETDCAIDIKSNQGTIALEVTAEKADYYKMLAANNYRTGGSAFNQKIWKKILYLAPLTTENANIAYLFPDNNEWISAREEDSEMKLWVNKAPLSDNITQVDAEIIHTATAQKFSLSQTTNIAEGEVVFPLPALTQHGYYSWRVKLARSTPSIFYNENAVSFFNFDPNPPICNQLYGWSRKSGKLQAPYIATNFKDEPLPSSGICTIEVYLNDGPGTPLQLVKTCTGGGSSAWCSYVGPYQEYLVSKTYTGYAVAYDCAGNKTQTGERSFTINPINPSRLTINSSVDQTATTGVPFQVTNVTVTIDGGDVPATGAYQTATSFVSTAGRYNITLQAPDSHNERPFSFWTYSIYCYNNPLTWAVSYGYSYNLTMQFGVSRFMIRPRRFTNRGSMCNSLSGQLNTKITKIEQIGGTPADLLGPAGYLNYTSYGTFNKTVVGEINSLVLRFNDSEDGILKFSHISSSGWSCVPDPNDPRQCQGSIIYRCGQFNPYYSIQRTVRVESYLGSDPVGGVGIGASGGMQEGTTTAGGYYTFSSIAQPNQFTGTLRAPEFILDSEGKEVEFGYWTGCESVSADGLGCYIGTGVTWFYDVTATVKAHYTSGAESEMPFLDVNRILTGAGDGTITGPSGICCGCVPTSKCDDYFATGTTVTLTAVPAADSYFVGWTVDCSGTNPTCNLSMTSDKQVWAEFALKPVLTVNITGNGTVTGDISCVGPGTCSASFNPSSAVSLSTDPDPNWEFTEWTGDVTSTSPTCSLLMDGDKTVNALFESIGPTAAMDCEIVDCGGPGCVCNGSWVTYYGVHYKLLNESTLPDPSIAYTSNWYYNGNQIGFSCTEPGDPPSGSVCSTTAGNIPVGTYNLKLVVEDEYGASSTIIQPITVRRDIYADFDCSLDGTTWQDCASINPLTGQTVYFRDQSTPSEGATINSWIWSKGDGTVFSEFAYSSTASTTLTSSINEILLEVTDSVGRSDSATRPLNVTFPLPEYREVAPVGQLDNFLARLANVFVRF